MPVYTPITYTQDLSVELTPGTAISILDGRYRDRARSLANKFSEAALQRGRVTMETLYLLALSDWEAVRTFNEQERQFLHALYQDFTVADFNRVKQIERGPGRGADVKAVELYIKERVQGTSLEDVSEMAHFALTSEDATNIALMSLTQQTVREDYLPALLDVIERLAYMSLQYKDTAMLARTHGRAAQPTTFGKELGVVARRVARWALKIGDSKLEGKLSGAVGNYTDHYSAFPDINWVTFSEEFVKQFGLVHNSSTTQILPYDEVIDLFGRMESANQVLVGLSQDMWRYISDDWVLLKRGGVSSVMAQKINPEDYERPEGALELANNDLIFLRRKLATSRLQRDLSNSLATRKFGDAFGFSILGYKSLLQGLNDSEPDREKMLVALRGHPEIISSMIQTILRRAGLQRPYETLQELVRGKKVTIDDLREFTTGLDVDEKTRERLLALDPETSFGAAPSIAERDAVYASEVVEEIRTGLDNR